MRSPGYDHPLYLLPFDYRASFQSRLFGRSAALSGAQAAEIAESKHLVYDAFKVAVASGAPRRKSGIMVDEQFGAAILCDAESCGYLTACPVEKSGQDEFDFDYGAEFTSHIKVFRPTFCKALVRYNPEGDAAVNGRQTARLRLLSDYLRAKSKSRFLLELMVPPESRHLEQCGGDRRRYEVELRPGLVAQAIEQLQDARVEPDLWMIGGCEQREECRRIVASVRRGERGQVGCIVVGHGEDEAQTRGWVATASAVTGFNGFAGGWAAFWDPLVRWRSKELSREEAINTIASNFHDFVNMFEERAAAA